MHGEFIGRSPTTLVCYVEIHGNLSMAGISAPAVSGASASGPPQPAHIGDMVFDAQTGNLLVAGFDG